jgi:LuxR family maltose regulon positive regulatory protein
LIGLAYTSQALGRPAEALADIDRLSGIDVETRGSEQMDTTSARARLLLMGGNIEAAERRVHWDVPQRADQSLAMWMEQTPLTQARILIARNKGTDSQLALQLLDVIGELAERTVNIRITIEVLALRALAMLNVGDASRARNILTRSVVLARRGPFTRTFVDLGPQMQKLLSQIAGDMTISKSVGRVLAAFPGVEVARAPVATLGLPLKNQVKQVDDDDFDERLTARELEVLYLMAEPISLRDIASRLNISYATARRYTINVYGKFDVHSRWEAVEIAIRKGIINQR